MMICCYYLEEYGFQIGYPGLKEVVVHSERVNMVVNDQEYLAWHPCLKVTGSPQQLLS